MSKNHWIINLEIELQQCLMKNIFLRDFQKDLMYFFSTWSYHTLFLNGLPHFMQMFILIFDVSYHTLCIHS